jgi:hypothetical protein
LKIFEFRGLAMTSRQKKIRLQIGFSVAASLLLVGMLAPKAASAEKETSIRVVVKEAEDDAPIYQAHLTLQFQEGRKLKRDKWIGFSAKTDKDGKCTFHHIPRGSIRLFVTSEHHQSYGKEFEIDQDNQLIEVKLRKPQPQI